MSDDPTRFTTSSGEDFSRDPTGRAAYRLWDGVKWGDQVTDWPDQPPRPDRFTAHDFRQLGGVPSPIDAARAKATTPAWVVWVTSIGSGTLIGFVIAFMLAVGATDQSGPTAPSVPGQARLTVVLLILGPVVGTVLGAWRARRVLGRRTTDGEAVDNDRG